VVRAARWLGLSYYDTRMTVETGSDVIEYLSARTHKNTAPAELIATYGPTTQVYHATSDTLDHWLTERYALYAALEPHRIVYGEIHHLPWPLQRADVELSKNTMTRALGLDLPQTKPICHFARYPEVVAWPIRPMNGCNDRRKKRKGTSDNHCFKITTGEAVRSKKVKSARFVFLTLWLLRLANFIPALFFRCLTDFFGSSCLLGFLFFISRHDFQPL
jgi:hypothetical protein